MHFTKFPCLDLNQWYQNSEKFDNPRGGLLDPPPPTLPPPVHEKIGERNINRTRERENLHAENTKQSKSKGHGLSTAKNFVNLLCYLFIAGRNNEFVCHSNAANCSQTTTSFTIDTKCAGIGLENR